MVYPLNFFGMEDNIDSVEAARIVFASIGITTITELTQDQVAIVFDGSSQFLRALIINSVQRSNDILQLKEDLPQEYNTLRLALGNLGIEGFFMADQLRKVQEA